MRLLGCGKLGAAGAWNAPTVLLWKLAIVSGLVYSAEAFIDIRAPASPDAATVETQPQEQVHIVFSSHLVGQKSGNSACSCESEACVQACCSRYRSR